MLVLDWTGINAVLSTLSVVFLTVIVCFIFYSLVTYKALHFWATLAVLILFGFRLFFVYWPDALGDHDASKFFNGPLGQALEFGATAALMLVEVVVIDRRVKEVKSFGGDKVLLEVMEKVNQIGEGSGNVTGT